MTACDLGAVTKPWEISRKVRHIGPHSLTHEVNKKEACKLFTSLWFQVAELVTSEFFEQGDRERSELKLTPSVSTLHQLWICVFIILFHPNNLHKLTTAKMYIVFHNSQHTDCVGNMSACIS